MIYKFHRASIIVLQDKEKASSCRLLRNHAPRSDVLTLATCLIAKYGQQKMHSNSSELDAVHFHCPAFLFISSKSLFLTS